MATFTDAAWDGSASRFASTSDYCASCLIDENPPGKDKVQSLCHLPVKEPGGDINTIALSSAAGRLLQTKTSASNKKKAARALVRYYQQAKMDVPDSLKSMAQ